MATHNSIGEFNSTSEDWSSYTDRLVHYFVAYSILEEGNKRRLVCRCKDQHLQCKLLAEPDLMFDKAFKIAKVMEAAEKEARDYVDALTVYQ